MTGEKLNLSFTGVVNEVPCQCLKRWRFRNRKKICYQHLFDFNIKSLNVPSLRARIASLEESKRIYTSWLQSLNIRLVELEREHDRIAELERDLAQMSDHSDAWQELANSYGDELAPIKNALLIYPKIDILRAIAIANAVMDDLSIIPSRQSSESSVDEWVQGYRDAIADLRAIKS